MNTNFKVQELKQKQAKWMNQRSQDSLKKSEAREGKSEYETSSGKNKPRSKKPAGKQPENKKEQESLVWIVGSGANKNTSKTLRSRSASPARKASPKNTQPINAVSSERGRGDNQSGESQKKKSENIAHLPKKLLQSEDDKLYGSEPNLTTKAAATARSEASSGVGHWEHPEEVTSATSRTGDQSAPGSSRSFKDGSAAQTRTTRTPPPAPRDAASATGGEGSKARGEGVGALMPPDLFDRLANQITDRLKSQLAVERPPAPTWSKGASLALEEDPGRDLHHCSQCRQLMVAPDHAPSMLTPCGHTFCEACAEDRIKCPACRTRVQASAPNDSLRLLILNQQKTMKPSVDSRRSYNSEKYSENVSQPYQTVHEKSVSADAIDRGQSIANAPTHPLFVKHTLAERDPNGSPPLANSEPLLEGREPRSVGGGVNNAGIGYSRTEEKGRRPKGVPAVNPAKYVEEFESLSIRLEAMKNEEETVRQRLDKIEQEREREQKQISKIEKEEERLRSQMAELEQRLQALGDHKADYHHKGQHLEEQKMEENQQLLAVRDMMRSIEHDRDRVKFLAAGLKIPLV